MKTIQYTLHNFKDICVRCKINADRFFMHHNIVKDSDIETYFGIYGYCDRCLENTQIGKRGAEDIEIFKNTNYTWADYLEVHSIIIS